MISNSERVEIVKLMDYLTHRAESGKNHTIRNNALSALKAIKHLYDEHNRLELLHSTP